MDVRLTAVPHDAQWRPLAGFERARPEAVRPLALAVAGIALAGGAVLRFWALGRQGFWYDESVTAWLLRGSPGQMLAAIPHTESTPPLYYLLAWLWARVAGGTEWGLRSLSALAGVATIAFAGLAARELVGRRAALVATVLVAVNPLLWWYSQEARSYSLLTAASAAGLWAFARWRAHPTGGRLVTWAALSCVAVATHYFAILAIAPQAVLVLLDKRLRAFARLAATGALVGTAGALGLLAASQSHRIYWFARIPLGLRIEQVGQFLLLGLDPSRPGPEVAVAAAAAACACACALVLRDTRPGAAIALAVAGSAVLVPMLMALVGPDLLNARNVIAAAVPLAILIAAGATADGPARTARLAAAAALVALSLVAIDRTLTHPGLQRPPWREVAAALRGPRGNRAILIAGSRTWARPLVVYLGDAWYPGPRGRAVREIDLLRRLAPRDACSGRTWWGALCDVGATPSPRAAADVEAAGLKPAGRTVVSGFEIDRYRGARPVRVFSRPPFLAGSNRGVLRGHRRLLVLPAQPPVEP